MHRSKFVPVLLIIVCSLTGIRTVSAQATPNRAQDEAALRQAGRDYLAAMEKGDLKALAEFWTADGTYTDEKGRTTKVRDILAKRASGAKLERPPFNVSNVTVRFIAADVAIEEGNCDVSAPQVMHGCFSALWVRQGGRWKLENLRESRAEPVVDPHPLAPLDMFVGEWSGESGKTTMAVSARWNATKTYIHREFSLLMDGKPAFHGTQEIGWDPASRQIKSWSFNDDGSHGTGLWNLEGRLWMVAVSRVLPDGMVATSTQTYKFLDRDSIVWKTIPDSVDDKALPELEVTLKRNKATK